MKRTCNENQIFAFTIVSPVEGLSIAVHFFSSFWIEKRLYTLFILCIAFYIIFAKFCEHHYIIKHSVYF